MKNKTLSPVKLIISALAVINLAVLLLFHYGIPENETLPNTAGLPGLGTTLQLPSRFPAVTDLDLPNLGRKLVSAGDISAADANGTDITDRIQFEADLDSRDERIAHATFSVQSDSDEKPVSITVSLPVTLNRPVLVLTTDTVSLARNEAFSPLSYVEEAVDASGAPVSDISVIGTVDTSVAGTSQVTLQAKDAGGYVSDPKTLTVTVG